MRSITSPPRPRRGRRAFHRRAVHTTSSQRGQAPGGPALVPPFDRNSILFYGVQAGSAPALKGAPASSRLALEFGSFTVVGRMTAACLASRTGGLQYVVTASAAPGVAACTHSLQAARPRRTTDGYLQRAAPAPGPRTPRERTPTAHDGFPPGSSYRAFQSPGDTGPDRPVPRRWRADRAS